MNKLKCNYCGVVLDHPHKSAICECGHLLELIPLTSGEFEKITDDYAIEEDSEEVEDGS